MAIEGIYEPSPWEPVAEQVRAYEQTGGREGGELQGKPCIILWTRGRQSGAIRKSPLMRVRDGDRYAVVASMGGAPKHPVWYLNLVADPQVSLQDGEVLRDYVARVTSGEEKAEWWKKATAVWPDYDNYQARTDRELPLVVLEPVVT
ncbi:MAG TPA: nitroreductase family deazaflavin-dependent oxidoreductase [Acidimicrobiales bacterium]|nr:nitroreductase family deazaflavin-dependent oxidoreductase [Acidimicrobiales bacterium]